MGTINIAVAEAGPTARDVMLAGPSTFPPSTTVAEGRAVFESPRQKLLVVCDGTRYVGAIRRDGLDAATDETATLDGFVDPAVPVMAPGDPSERVPDVVARTGLNRIPVVDADGDLLGLVCFNPGGETFCVAA